MNIRTHASSYEESQAEVAKMVEQLRRNGWSGDTDFQSHAAVVKRNGVDARFDVYHPDDRLSAITLYGECRDVTTTQNTMNEPVPPAELQ